MLIFTNAFLYKHFKQTLYLNIFVFDGCRHGDEIKVVLSAMSTNTQITYMLEKQYEPKFHKFYTGLQKSSNYKHETNLI